MPREPIRHESGLGSLWRGDEKLTGVGYDFTVYREFERTRAPQPDEIAGLWDSLGSLNAEDLALDLRHEDLELELKDRRRLPVHLISLWFGKGLFSIRTGEAVEAYLAPDSTEDV